MVVDLEPLFQKSHLPAPEHLVTGELQWGGKNEIVSLYIQELPHLSTLVPCPW